MLSTSMSPIFVLSLSDVEAEENEKKLKLINYSSFTLPRASDSTNSTFPSASIDSSLYCRPSLGFQFYNYSSSLSYQEQQITTYVG